MTQEISNINALAFKEDAISEADATAAIKEIRNNDVHEEPCFMDDDGPSQDIPTHIMLKTSREMFGVCDDETLEQALERLSSAK